MEKAMNKNKQKILINLQIIITGVLYLTLLFAISNVAIKNNYNFFEKDYSYYLISVIFFILTYPLLAKKSL
jgi:cytochrome c biogenesis factor